MQNAKNNRMPVQGKGVQRVNAGSMEAGVEASFGWGDLGRIGINALKGGLSAL